VHLEVDEFVIDDAASNVMNDPVGSFLDLFEFSIEPKDPGPRVCLWLEPSGYAIDVLPTDEPNRCALRISYAKDFLPTRSMYRPIVRFEGDLAANELRGGLLDGLAGLLEGPGADALDRWRRDHGLDRYRDRFDALRARIV
jgi:hypothetical protein